MRNLNLSGKTQIIQIKNAAKNMISNPLIGCKNLLPISITRLYTAKMYFTTEIAGKKTAFTASGKGSSNYSKII
ncbi:MAG: hypothetical protein JW915_05145 [Chitinispirillaceae bacterium]|nr:hypothetical protein [Chitinispirillaceae bacterium]